MKMYMEHDGPPDTKPRGSSGYLPGGVSGEKPAPTAAEIEQARGWFTDNGLDALSDIGFPDTVRNLLAAIDAAEARAAAAEALAKLPPDYCYSCGGTGGHWEACLGTTPMIALNVSLRTAERERDELRTKLDGEREEYERGRATILELRRERDAARAALKPFAEYAPACRALQADDVILEEDADGINVYELTAGAFFTAADVLTKEAPRG